MNISVLAFASILLLAPAPGWSQYPAPSGDNPRSLNARMAKECRTEGETGQIASNRNSTMSGWCDNCHHNSRNGEASGRHPAHPPCMASALRTLSAWSFNQLDTGENKNESEREAIFISASLSSIQKLTRADPGNVLPLKPAAADETVEAMCLSCHQAHAAGFDYLPYTDRAAVFLTNDPGDQLIDDPEALGYDPVAYWFTVYQHFLCTRCHREEPPDR